MFYLNNKKIRLLMTFIIAIIWGYFADLRHGDIGWFIGKIIFMPTFHYIIFERGN